MVNSAKPRGGPHPGTGYVAVAVAQEADAFALPAAQLFVDQLKVGQDLAGMLFISQCIDGGQRAVMRKVLHILLGKGADHRAMHHAAHDTCRVLHGFAAAQLHVGSAEEHDAAAQLTDAHFKTDPGARRGLAENQRPTFAAENLRGSDSVFAQCRCQFDNVRDVSRSQGFDGEQVLHAKEN